jgi:quercetin dioxygenase-like cupin family protein
VIVLVLSGEGQVGTELGTVNLHAGALAWLPRRSRRQIGAGPQGLTYLTMHKRRPALTLDTATPH